jgi:hypothetical protein
MPDPLKGRTCTYCGHDLGDKPGHYVPPGFGTPGFPACEHLCEFCKADAQVQPVELRRGHRRPDAHYRQVAEVWLAAWQQRKPKPNKAVVERWGVPSTTAANWVRTARRRGILTQRYQRTHQCPGCGHRIPCERGDP